MINFKKTLYFFSLILLSGFLWWLLLLFNTFPKKFYNEEMTRNPNKLGIVVLTGGKMRIEKGVNLLAKGYGGKLFISGAFKPSDIKMKYGDEKVTKELFDCCVFFGDKAKNTLENAYEVQKWLQGNPEINNIMLVSSYYHLPRSLMIFEKKINSDIIIYPVLAESDIDLRTELFFHIKLIISEYFKVIYTLVFLR